MAESYNNSIFWVEVEKIESNPLQPRREFAEDKLRALADSIRQYGVLQPLVVTRREIEREDGGLAVAYELIAGERRLRAARLAGVFQVPVVIRAGEETDKLKLEIAIIENLQREDLNPVDRGRAFRRLVEEFNLKHVEISKKIGKSREYVTNSIRILAMPEHMITALVEGKIVEGHTRPILMLTDRPQEQETLFQEILVKRLNVREAEEIARSIAAERTRKRPRLVEPEILELEQRLTQQLGTRVRVERREIGGKVTIDFFSNDDLHVIFDILSGKPPKPLAASAQQELEDEAGLYNIKNFTI